MKYRRHSQNCLQHSRYVADQPDQKITKKEMAQIAEDQKIITINAEQENHSQARFASLDKNIIAPLEKEWKLSK